MTVKEFIEVLSKYPQDMVIATRSDTGDMYPPRVAISEARYYNEQALKDFRISHGAIGIDHSTSRGKEIEENLLPEVEEILAIQDVW
jgi:hypothetical protein